MPAEVPLTYTLLKLCLPDKIQVVLCRRVLRIGTKTIQQRVRCRIQFSTLILSLSQADQLCGLLFLGGGVHFGAGATAANTHQDRKAQKEMFFHVNAGRIVDLLNAAPHLPPPRRHVGRKHDIQILPSRRAENAGGG